MPKIISNTVQAHIACFPKGSDRPLFLLLKRAENETIYPNVWQAVTGWIEPGETALETALRELNEETGLVPEKIMDSALYHIVFRRKKRRNSSVSRFRISC